MNDNKPNTKEELLFSLPDYINGKITDSSLKSDIENLIVTDEEFRTEYLALKNTLEFIADTPSEAPPEHYFTSLLPRINSRLDNVVSRKPSLRGILHLWRYVVPALTVILVIIIVSLPEKNKFEVALTDSHNVSGTNSIINDTVKESVSESQNDETLLNSESGNSTTIVNYLKTRKISFTENENYIEGISDFLGGEDEQPDEIDYYTYESDFGNLSPSEQNEIISNLSKTKF